MKSAVFAALMAAALPAIAIAGDPSSSIYVTSGRWTSLISVDVTTGDRGEILLEEYPLVLKATDYAVDFDGTFFVETVDALKRTGIYRVNPLTSAKIPVSGGVDGFAEELLGDGPEFLHSINTIVRGPESLFVLCDAGGIMEVNPASGDRRLVVDRDPPAGLARGIELPMHGPVDMVMLNASTLLVADQFQQLILVDARNGSRSRFLPQSILTVTPRKMDLLTEHFLVYCGVDPDTDAIWRVDLHSGEEMLYSGSFGGFSRGTGPEFDFLSDVAVDSSGQVWAFDVGASAVIRISPEGDRTVVSSPSVGNGVEFFEPDARPTLGNFARPVPGFATQWMTR